jgi:hypothetical protein
MTNKSYKILKNGNYSCLFCNKEYSKKGIGTHIWRRHGDGINWNRCNDFSFKVIWNKGLTKETNKKIKIYSERLKNKYKNGELIPSFLGKKHSEKTKENWKKNKNMGGIRSGSGKGIKGWYREFYCRSTWELAWLVFQIEHNIKVSKCNESFKYVFENKEHKYFPDFMIGDIYFEIKGFRRKNVSEKINQFPKNKKLILIEGKKEIKPYLTYCKEKYGKEFWKTLYNT